ncbi:uncharacterized protein LOC117117510 isoform X2 [Anneissia japonica]|uniref:uncharacterized protein LOC117117510 isoform X2 n=1 Tax=Anneissia japonica TaxID=1529436 RepID=UPI001425B365|nr:uncharacterized protein LOC117117510 isoform X2 [Anneissia japonica]
MEKKRKRKVFDPQNIRGQFIFTKFVMLKMFLAAGAVSLLLMGLMSVLPPSKNMLQDVRQSLASTYQSKGLLTTVIGGFILGAGMQLSGSCPGMVLVQVGTWVGNGSACVTLVAGLLGAFIYGFIEPYLSKLLSPKKMMQKFMLDDYVPLPFSVLTTLCGMVMVAIVIGLEFAFPWQDGERVRNDTSDCFLTALAWPPYISGKLIFIVQRLLKCITLKGHQICISFNSMANFIMDTINITTR